MILGLAVLFAVFYLLIWPLISEWRMAYAELNDKQQLLETARKLSEMEEAMGLLELKVERELGVIGEPIISEELFDRIAERFSVGEEEGMFDINKATMRDLMQVEGMNSAKAMEIIRFRRMLGGFSNLDQLREIRSSIFEEGDEQAAIIGKISQIAKRSGIRRIDQLSVRPVTSTKPILVAQHTKLDLVKKLFAAELELQMDAIRNGKRLMTRLSFPLLPAELPDQLKLRIAEAILGKGNVLSKDEYEGIISDYLAEIPSEEEEPLPIEEEIASILSGFSEESELIQEEEEPRMERVDPKQALEHLMGYNQEVKEKRGDLLKLVGGIPASYKPRVYLVDVVFKAKLENFVNFMSRLQESVRWLDPKGLRIGIADEKRELLGIQLTIIASAL